MQNMKMDGASFFGSMQTAVSKDGKVKVADGVMPEKGFATVLGETTETPEALNSEAAFSAMELLSADETDLLNKIESLEDIDALLKQISELLGLSVDMEKSLYRVDPENVPEEMVSQLADFLAGMKELVQLITTSAEQGISVPINGEEVSGEELENLAQQLKTDIVALELAFTKLDISDQVQSEVAHIQQKSSTGGIPVAITPEELSKRAEEQKLPEAIAKLFQKEESELESILSSIRKLAIAKPKEEKGENALEQLSKQGSGVKESLKLLSESKGSGTKQESGEEKKGEPQKSPLIASSNVADTTVISSTVESTVKDAVEMMILNENGEVVLEKSTVEIDAQTEIPETAEEVETMKLATSISGMTDNVAVENELQQELSAALAEVKDIEIQGESVKTPAMERAHTPRTFEQLVIDQVSGKLQDAVREGSREVTIVLKPEFLGEVKVTIQLDGDIVAAKLQVESQQVKQIVENNFQNLRDALQEHNLKMGALDVNVGNGQSERRAEEESSPKRRRKSGLPADLEEFEDDPFVEDFMGKETGRRFGNNSVEYFA